MLEIARWGGWGCFVAVYGLVIALLWLLALLAEKIERRKVNKALRD